MGKYQSYDKYKDSGVEWLGDIPNHWKKLSLRWLIQTNSGDFISNLDTELEMSSEAYIPVVGGNGIMSFTDKNNTEANSIVIGRVGAHCGNVHLFKERIWVTDNALRMTIKSKLLDSIFLFWLLKSLNLNNTANKNAQPLITGEMVKSRSVAIPPLEEQEKIARFLDYKTKQIDELIAKKETLIEKLDEKRTSLISHAVTKGLDVNVPMKDSGIEWLGEIPKHWDISKAKFVSRIFVPQRNKPDLNLDDGFSWLTMDDMLSDTVTNTTFKVTKEAAQNAGSRVLKKGSVVASCVGNFGVCAVINVDVIINQQLQAFIPDKNIIPEFLREIVKISKDYFQMIATAATVVYVNQSGFANMPIILPPKEEQEKIINYIAITKEKLEEQKAKIQQAIDVLKEYRTALITNAVTGKINVSQVDIP